MPSLEDRKSIVVSSPSSASSPPYSPSETSSRGPAPKPRGRPRKSPSTPRKRSSTSTSRTSRPIARQGKAAGSTGGRSGLGVGMGSTHEGRRTGPWTKEEVRALADAVIIIPTAVPWAKVAEQVPGRDKLSCSNKWRYDLLPKVQAFIDSLGV